MMKQIFNYGTETITASFPEQIQSEILDSHVHTQLENEEETVRNACNHADISLQEAVLRAKFIAIIVSDYSRPTGSQICTKIILEKLRQLGFPEERINIVIALGLHRPATQLEIDEITGGHYSPKITLENHNPDGNLIDVGNIQLNATVMAADLIILTGAVTYHPMAGFSGGYKSLLPGVAGRKSILENHRLFFLNGEKNPAIYPGSIQDNPVQNHIRSSCTKINRSIYCLNVVLGQDKYISFAAAGSVDYAWQACCRYVDSINSVHIDQKFPFVVASAGGFPSDFSFYQCMKVLTNSSIACEAKGQIVIIAQCAHGWEIDETLLKWFALSPPEVAQRLCKNFRMDGLAVYMAMRIIKTHTVYLYSSLPSEEVRKAGMIPLKDTKTLEELVKKNGNRSIVVMPHGAQTLPIVREN